MAAIRSKNARHHRRLGHTGSSTSRYRVLGMGRRGNVVSGDGGCRRGRRLLGKQHLLQLALELLCHHSLLGTLIEAELQQLVL